jgi:hypothetical protein
MKTAGRAYFRRNRTIDVSSGTYSR